MTTKKKREPRPDYKKQLDALRAEVVNQNRLSQRIVNSNNEAIRDLQDLVRLRGEAVRAQAALDQGFAAITKKLDETHSPFGLASWLPR